MGQGEDTGRKNMSLVIRRGVSDEEGEGIGFQKRTP